MEETNEVIRSDCNYWREINKFRYGKRLEKMSSDGTRTFDNVDFQIELGEGMVLLGHNDSDTPLLLKR
ncbi:hypothetical protein [Alkalibacterium sp. 20]|uniref:hypothetical protein n=1 Tax=Alkalibacterium sp. 20 TaxID=1798803 RepID=UPI000B0BB0F4|nr:hypothetical protein [Alkalibacterium sp. 20]